MKRKHLLYTALALTALIFPAWLVGTWLGVWPFSAGELEPVSKVWVFIILVPVLSAALLTLLALRDARLNPDLPDKEKMTWREAILVFGVFGAMVYFFRFRRKKRVDS